MATSAPDSPSGRAAVPVPGDALPWFPDEQAFTRVASDALVLAPPMLTARTAERKVL